MTAVEAFATAAVPLLVTVTVATKDAPGRAVGGADTVAVRSVVGACGAAVTVAVNVVPTSASVDAPDALVAVMVTGPGVVPAVSAGAVATPSAPVCTVAVGDPANEALPEVTENTTGCSGPVGSS
ncbi:hypothetical protein GCM10023175_29870 [Pseudonocardia xishanensis]|uniref:Secreted protein n=1 Tax=Pseudonocardia xishanensis TaxID=630995 RepID=A0ABP8RTN8_9PSEU